VIMKPGDMLVFYTDGIVETRGGSQREAPRETPPRLSHPAAAPLEEYGVERLLAVARRHQGQPSQAVVEAIFADVEEWSLGAPADDDRTVVVVTSPAADQSITASFPRPIGLI
jgi:sigma-B regulation protein RsbU (phosphoserine phosphatase)